MSTYSLQTKYSTLLPSDSGIIEHDHTNQYWRSLFYFNIYRLVISSILVIITWKFHFTSFGSYHYLLFLYAGLGYVLFGSLSMLFIKLRRPNFSWQLTIQVLGDIVFFSVMLYASGGLQSGLGGLLLVSLAGAGLISRGRMALFFASIATISLLLQETYALLTIDFYSAQYSQTGLLSMSYFAVAWLAHQLAKHTLVSELLAKERGIDLANMAQVNQLVIQHLQEGILVVDKNGNIRQHNTYAEKLLGLNASANKTELLKLADYVPEIADRLANWQGDSDISFDLLRLNHSNTLVRTRFLPIRTDSRSGVVIFLEDIGRIEAQLQQLKLAALGRLTANIAHEIRNPLSAINHAAELLEEEQLANNADPRLIRIICDNTKRLSKIVQDVLRLNRRHISKFEVIDVKEFIRNFLEEFCQTENININKFIFNSSKGYLINFDRDHLSQVLWNLCRNAWRHCRKQAGSIHIELSAGTNKNNVYLDIIDDGPGVAPQQIRKIFEPFFTTAAGGTGLGLYVARELCEANQALLEYIEGPMGGHLRVICKNSSIYE
ncbi:nitrogen regulation protein NR(II) [Nitrosomonas sp. Nm166]|uniref:two-component system sensor histidine kinase NtrB n=1 Tax=Nitrosomonas sp. Nm166 TaxID=1881054 RepID=UPI0008E6C575|nr:ATP-binding protein [Nitrosomonas sp. Nm166]SFE95137.1 two-component system, NtrC family, sensor histidine kinase PilS [Nitrosomonas sp. Nm166]